MLLHILLFTCEVTVDVTFVLTDMYTLLHMHIHTLHVITVSIRHVITLYCRMTQVTTEQ